jgi:NADPH-dependent glutamate synthase beta subunit-like oxidoreductase
MLQESRGPNDVSTLLELARRAPTAAAGKRVAVIGAGVAGLTCAHDLALLGYRVTVFEAQSVAGGMLVLGVPEYRLPRDLVQAEIQAILNLGVELRLNQGLGRDFYLQDLKDDGFEAIFIAIGAHKSRGLPLEGVEFDGVLRAIDFLLNVNLGFTVDLGRNVVVIGGGDVAMDSARSAARELFDAEVEAAKEDYFGDLGEGIDPTGLMHEVMDVARAAMQRGAREVHVVCLEDWTEMPASQFEIEEALNEGVQIHPRRGPKRIVGEDGKVVGLETLACSSVFDADGRFNPIFVSGSEEVLEADSVVMAIGQTSDLDWIRPEDGIETTPRKTIWVDRLTMATTALGVFAGGDVALGPRLFIEGVESGHRAARNIHTHLTGKGLRPAHRSHWVPLDYVGQLFSPTVPTRPFIPSVWEGYTAIPRKDPLALPIERRIGINEVELGFEPSRARAQARRCLKCSISPIFDGSRCIACGGCVDVCPSRCLRMAHTAQVEGDEAVAGLLAQEPGGTAMLMDASRCLRCALCALRCPTGSISMEQFQFLEEWTYAD